MTGGSGEREASRAVEGIDKGVEKLVDYKEKTVSYIIGTVGKEKR